MERDKLEQIANQVHGCASLEADFYECQVVTLVLAPDDGTFTLRAGGMDLNTLVGVLTRASVAATHFGPVVTTRREGGLTEPEPAEGAAS